MYGTTAGTRCGELCFGNCIEDELFGRWRCWYDLEIGLFVSVSQVLHFLRQKKTHKVGDERGERPPV